MKPFYLVAGVRTPFTKMGTALAGLSAADLGVHAVKALLARTGLDPAVVDEVIFGCVGQPADAANIARVIALRAGLPETTIASTVHRNCASGMEAFTTAFERNQAGSGDVFICGGAESMSRLPLIFPQGAGAKFARLASGRGQLERLGALFCFRPRDFAPRAALHMGLTDPVAGLNMGETAEILARDYHVTREAQDVFALRSHQHAAAAAEKLAEEIAPVYTEAGAVAADNGIRPNSDMGKLATLRPVFDQACGTVTAGNASQISDGAVALLAMSEAKMRALGLEPLARLERYAYAGCDPRRMGLGPVHALSKAGRPIGEAEVIELNEAFAAQVLAVEKELGGLPPEALNPNGGAIALGHPVGATGARLLLSCALEMQRRQARSGVATLCIGGGQGGAVWLERD